MITLISTAYLEHPMEFQKNTTEGFPKKDHIGTKKKGGTFQLLPFFPYLLRIIPIM